VMRKIFDSTQMRLQEITNAALPPPPSAKSADSVKR
jgi:hypothetical protein